MHPKTLDGERCPLRDPGDEASITTPYINAVLRAMAPSSQAALQLNRVDFAVGAPIYEPHVAAEYAYFPEKGVLSVVSQFDEGRNIEVETIGKESMAGSFIILGIDRLPFRTFVQVPGFGYRTSLHLLREVIAKEPSAIDAVSKAEAALRTQGMQNAACNGMHSVEQRCCRWLLMSRDRTDSDELKLTHEFLSEMLGVRRATVSEVLSPFQEAGIVRSNRGIISMLNREAIESRVCECYWRLRAAEPKT